MSDDTIKSEINLELIADIVSAYVSNNPVPTNELAALIANVSAALSGLGQGVEPAPVLTPTVNPKKSVFPDYIVSLEDGRKFKSMKRHLGLLGMTPDEYRAKWVSTAEQNQAIGRRKSRPLRAASGERREGVARPEFPACGVGDFCEGFSQPFGRGFERDGSYRRSSREC